MYWLIDLWASPIRDGIIAGAIFTPGRARPLAFSQVCATDSSESAVLESGQEDIAWRVDLLYQMLFFAWNFLLCLIQVVGIRNNLVTMVMWSVSNIYEVIVYIQNQAFCFVFMVVCNHHERKLTSLEKCSCATYWWYYS